MLTEPKNLSIIRSVFFCSYQIRSRISCHVDKRLGIYSLRSRWRVFQFVLNYKYVIYGLYILKFWSFKHNEFKRAHIHKQINAKRFEKYYVPNLLAVGHEDAVLKMHLSEECTRRRKSVFGDDDVMNDYYYFLVPFMEFLSISSVIGIL